MTTYLPPTTGVRQTTTMRIGLGLPQLGPFADPQATCTVARAAEKAGFASLWAMDRLLSPVAPRTMRYPGSADGALPKEQQIVLDPLVALTVAAAVTERISVGTDVLVAPWYPPVLLARSLATLDQASAGRLVVGLGLGWSVDEFDAVGAPMRQRGARLDEILDVMETLWNAEATEMETSHERIAASVVGLKPVQRPHPPILLAASTPAGLERVARRADGWLPFGLPLDGIRSMWASVRQAAERHGRDPEQLQLVLRGDPTFTDVRLGADRMPFTGTWQQVIDDIRRARELGVAELILDLQTSSRSPDELVETAIRLTEEDRTVLAA